VLPLCRGRAVEMGSKKLHHQHQFLLGHSLGGFVGAEIHDVMHEIHVAMHEIHVAMHEIHVAMHEIDDAMHDIQTQDVLKINDEILAKNAECACADGSIGV
jgi:hypothetical protein